MQQHLNSSDISPEEIPEGFTTGAGPATEQQNESQKRELQRRGILEQSLTSEAWSRLGTIRLVKPEKVAIVENNIISMAMSGKLSGKINEGKLIEMLEGILARSNTSKTTINIQRKKYAFESDDEGEDADDDIM
jgi:programmed cell death protein 5